MTNMKYFPVSYLDNATDSLAVKRRHKKEAGQAIYTSLGTR